MNIEKIIDEKFKSIYISYNFTLPMKNKEMFSYNALLGAIMQKGAKNYPNLKAIENKLSMLYGATYDINVDKYGDLYNFQFRMNFINKKFLPDNEELLNEVLDFLYEMIYNPKDWTDDEIEREKEFILEKINERRDEKLAYVSQKMEELLCKDEPYGTYIFGDEETIKSATKEDLKNAYENIIGSTVNVYVAGNLNGYEDIEKTIEEKFASKVTNTQKLEDLPTDNTRINSKEHTYTKDAEPQDIVQSAISLGGYIKDITVEDSLPLAIFNGIFGVTPSCKLFQNVREKASLCYTVSARILKLKGLIIVYAGINAQNYEKAVSLIKEQLEDMKKGNFTDEELQCSIDSAIASLRDVRESKYLSCMFKYSNKIAYKKDMTFEEIEEAYKKITREDIIRVANKIEFTNEFIIGGVQNA